ncbi:hypothetical protein BV25DRAFT_1180764 [Artomyces pyxidatus]|uniref:Uncharacterized protein n=1 Tax=Artomyces pyxidatus TaxID=48021 RepID=A0ACB8SR15_9AGAM|nr:hypothetical protein BV25DRAFT_1180764 [Artomyces pyxidatus]
MVAEKGGYRWRMLGDLRRNKQRGVGLDVSIRRAGGTVSPSHPRGISLSICAGRSPHSSQTKIFSIGAPVHCEREALSRIMMPKNLYISHPLGRHLMLHRRLSLLAWRKRRRLVGGLDLGSCCLKLIKAWLGTHCTEPSIALSFPSKSQLLSV